MKSTIATLYLFVVMATAAARAPYRFSDGYLDVLGGEPNEAFTCENRLYGYYADVANDCRIFHICVPIEDEQGQLLTTHHFSFFCGNQTVFSQDTLTCSHESDALPCEQAESFYDLSNADFGKIPDDALERK